MMFFSINERFSFEMKQNLKKEKYELFDLKLTWIDFGSLICRPKCLWLLINLW